MLSGVVLALSEQGRRQTRTPNSTESITMTLSTLSSSNTSAASAPINISLTESDSVLGSLIDINYIVTISMPV
jgi:hypothetical protein